MDDVAKQAAVRPCRHVSVVLAICTMRRPAGLRRLLEAVRETAVPELVAVVVVDNDRGLEGKAQCDAIAGAFPCRLICVHEQAPGISSARNRAVAEARALRPDFIAMLDDDEWPDRDWLQQFLRVQRATGADIVGGPVVPIPASAVPHWDTLASHYGLLRDLADGAECTLFGAGNFIARRECFEAIDGPFDRAFDRVGGEDLHFFWQLERLGWKTRWAAHARVSEETPASRLSMDWLMRRQQRRGFINVRVQRRIDPSLGAEARRVARSLGVVSRAAWRRCVAAGRPEPKGLLAKMYWRYALGRLRGHGLGDGGACGGGGAGANAPGGIGHGGQ